MSVGDNRFANREGLSSQIRVLSRNNSFSTPARINFSARSVILGPRNQACSGRVSNGEVENDLLLVL